MALYCYNWDLEKRLYGESQGQGTEIVLILRLRSRLPPHSSFHGTNFPVSHRGLPLVVRRQSHEEGQSREWTTQQWKEYKSFHVVENFTFSSGLSDSLESNPIPGQGLWCCVVVLSLDKRQSSSRKLIPNYCNSVVLRRNCEEQEQFLFHKIYFARISEFYYYFTIRTRNTLFDRPSSSSSTTVVTPTYATVPD